MLKKEAKSGQRNLFGGAAVYLLGNIIAAAIPFFLLPILTRVLLPSEFGEVALFQLVFTAIIAMIGLSIDGAAGRKFFDKGMSSTEMSAFIVSALQLSIFSTIIILMVIAIFGSWLSLVIGIPTMWIYLAALTAFATMLIRIRLNQWQVRGSAYRFIGLQVITSSLNFGGSILLVVTLLRGAEGRIEAQVVSVLTVAVLAAISLSKSGLLGRPNWRPDYMHEILLFGAPLIPHVLGAFLIFSFDRLLISSKVGLTEAGIYMVAVQIAIVVGMAFDSLNNAYVPWLYEKLSSDDRSQSTLSVRNTYKAFGIISIAAVILFMAVPSITDWVTGEKFKGAGELARFLVVGQIVNGMYQLISNYLLFNRRTKVIAATTIVVGAMHVALILLLIPVWGALGASIAFFATMTIRFFATWILAIRVGALPRLIT